jgi:RNA polymerase sigma-70 factor (ECF subfamily)
MTIAFEKYASTPSDEPLDDAAVVRRVLAGDGALFELIMRRHNRLLFRLARAIVREDDEARDVVQAAYVLAYFHLDQFRGPTGFTSWLARIAVNEAYGRSRRGSALVAESHDLLTLPDWEAAEPENAAIGRDLLRVLQTEIDRLPEEFRTVFMLRGVEELSVAETAAVLDIKAATVKTRFHRARRLLQQALRPEHYDAARDAFRFDGTACDRIVADVFSRILADPRQGGPRHDTPHSLRSSHGAHHALTRRPQRRQQ